MNILIVDDNNDDRTMLRCVLQTHGHDVIEAVNGQEGLQTASVHRLDLIISDALMPVMDGFQFLRTLRRSSTVPFVFYSAAYDGSREMQLAASLGADGYLLKPQDPVELMKEIERIAGEEPKEKSAGIEEDQFLERYSQVVASKLEEKVRELEKTLVERKRYEQLEKIRSRVFEQLAYGGEMKEILAPVVEYMEQSRPGFICSILILDKTGKRLFHGTTPNLPEEYVRAIDGIEIGDGVGSCGTAAWRGETVIVEDIATHPYWENFKDAALKAGLLSCWSEPVIGSSGQLLATFAVYQRQTGGPSESDLALIRQMRHLIVIGIEHKREETIRRAKAEEFHALVENSPDAIVRFDRLCRIVYANPALEWLVGTSVDLLTGKTPSEGFMATPEVGRQIQGALEEVLDRGVLLELELPWKDSRGELRHFQIRFAPEFNANGEVESVLSITRDITSLRKTETQLQHAQKMECIGALAGGVAHDFNNILAVISGYSELLLHTLTDDELTYAREISDSVIRGAELTRTLLMFGGKHEPQRQYDDLNQILVNLRKSMSRLLRSDITLTFGLCDGRLPMFVDRNQIEQVLVNLMVNARDALTSGGIITVITELVEVREEVVTGGATVSSGSYGVVTVTDNGVGMDADTVGRIFEPFFTTKESGKGTGLGLAIAFGIVSTHDGHILVESVPGKGSVFRIFLPIFKGAMTPKFEQKPEAAELYGNETVLVVDDESSVLQMTSKLLARYGYAVLTAADGVEALEVFEAHRDNISVAIIDLIMPRMNGRETIKEMRRQKPDLPVILTSGYADDIIDSAAIDAMDIVFLSKPVRPQKLAATIRAALERNADAPQKDEWFPA